MPRKAPFATTRNLARYLAATPLPHLTASLAAAVGACLARKGFFHLAESNHLAGAALTCLAVSWLMGALFCAADGLSRYREYQRVRRMLTRFGYDQRILRPASGSRCQRDAAIQAARDAGLACQVRQHFRELGYRWYHLLPDRITANPIYFFTPHFWRTTFVPGKRTERRHGAPATSEPALS